MGARFTLAIAQYLTADIVQLDSKALNNLIQLPAQAWKGRVERTAYELPVLNRLLKDAYQNLPGCRRTLTPATMLGASALILAIRDSRTLQIRDQLDDIVAANNNFSDVQTAVEAAHKYDVEFTKLPPNPTPLS